MLYEVITLDASKGLGRLIVNSTELMVESQDWPIRLCRITSYNVCYTKLLREQDPLGGHGVKPEAEDQDPRKAVHAETGFLV